MNDCMAIHETVIKELLDAWEDLKDIDYDEVTGKFTSKSGKTLNPMRVSSISKLSSNLTCVFPIICSRGISIENASMISKAIEKRATTMLQMLFAAYQVSDKDNVEAYVKQFHRNLATKGANLDDLFKIATTVESSIWGNLPVVSETAFEEACRRDSRNLDYRLPSNINEASIDDTLNDLFRAATKVMNKKDDSNKGPKENIDVKNALNVANMYKAAGEGLKNQVPDAEYKKANELTPTMLSVNFMYKNDKGENIPVQSGVVGVKAKLYPISSEEVIKNIVEKTQNRNWLTNFIRATTREISFVKDFALAIDKAKIDAMSFSTRRNASSKMWKVLERRATNSRLKRALGRNNDASAITTLCISQEEVEVLRKNYSIDMEQVKNVYGLFESLNLMCFVIVDETLEVAKFIFDEEDPMWETISFTHLERESNDNTYKRVVNLMTKMSR